MTFPYTTPILGILAGDAPSQNMVVVAYMSETLVKWAYVTPGHNRGKNVPLDRHEDFTPLTHFGVHATMTPDGLLALNQLIPISIATYPDGRHRPWQGSPSARVALIPRFGGYVVEAVHADFESRRAKAEAKAEATS